MIIKLDRRSKYKYDSVYRFYGWEHAADIVPITDCGAKNIGEFYLACLSAWNSETCSERFRQDWSPDDPSVGQCTITAHIVHELFGGEVFGLPLQGGGMHSFNRINGVIIDLACEQFGKNVVLDFSEMVPVEPDTLLLGADKAERRALLRRRLGEILQA